MHAPPRHTSDILMGFDLKLKIKQQQNHNTQHAATVISIYLKMSNMSLVSVSPQKCWDIERASSSSLTAISYVSLS